VVVVVAVSVDAVVSWLAAVGFGSADFGALVHPVTMRKIRRAIFTLRPTITSTEWHATPLQVLRQAPQTTGGTPAE